jgi:endonuclease/exonuclease/phosphatase family metal-dependent hydrolase
MPWRRRVLKTFLVIIGLFVLAFAYRVLGVYEFRAGECSARDPIRFANTYPKRLVVMTFNIEGHASLVRGNHIEEIAKVIRKYQPDVVGINEAHRGTWQVRFGDHMNDLTRLTGMNAVFGRSYTFLGGHFGNAVLTRGRILKSEVHDLPGTGEPRSLLEAIVNVNGGTIEFYVTHTAAWASLGREARDSQLKCINAHVQAAAHPFIVVGDLNAPPEAPEMAKFLALNTLKFAGDPAAPTHRVMEQRLDYILIDPGWQVRAARVLDDGPSDHRPVLAELVHP